MNSTRVGVVLVALGVAVVVLSALADPIGLGDGDGIGWKQSTGMIVGGVVAIAGAALVWRQRRAPTTTQSV